MSRKEEEEEVGVLVKTKVSRRRETGKEEASEESKKTAEKKEEAREGAVLLAEKTRARREVAGRSSLAITEAELSRLVRRCCGWWEFRGLLKVFFSSLRILCGQRHLCVLQQRRVPLPCVSTLSCAPPEASQGNSDLSPPSFHIGKVSASRLPFRGHGSAQVFVSVLLVLLVEHELHRSPIRLSSPHFGVMVYANTALLIDLRTYFSSVQVERED